jgi:hypothetical protein
MGVVGDDEAVQIKIESVLHRSAVDLGDEPAGLCKRSPVESYPLADGGQLLRRLAGMGALHRVKVKAFSFC